jgi:hypothetical protein
MFGAKNEDALLKSFVGGGLQPEYGHFVRAFPREARQNLPVGRLFCCSRHVQDASIGKQLSSQGFEYLG